MVDQETLLAFSVEWIYMVFDSIWSKRFCLILDKKLFGGLYDDICVKKILIILVT